MKKNKKLLMFLALNSVSASFAATGQLSAKSERIYNSIVKNIKSEKKLSLKSKSPFNVEDDN